MKRVILTATLLMMLCGAAHGQVVQSKVEGILRDYYIGMNNAHGAKKQLADAKAKRDDALRLLVDRIDDPQRLVKVDAEAYSRSLELIGRGSNAHEFAVGKLESHPSSLELHSVVVRYLLARGDHNNCLKAIRKAITATDQASHLSRYYGVLAIRQGQLGNIESSLQCFGSFADYRIHDAKVDIGQLEPLRSLSPIIANFCFQRKKMLEVNHLLCKLENLLAPLVAKSLEKADTSERVERYLVTSGYTNLIGGFRDREDLDGVEYIDQFISTLSQLAQPLNDSKHAKKLIERWFESVQLNLNWESIDLSTTNRWAQTIEDDPSLSMELKESIQTAIKQIKNRREYLTSAKRKWPGNENYTAEIAIGMIAKLPQDRFNRLLRHLDSGGVSRISVHVSPDEVAIAKHFETHLSRLGIGPKITVTSDAVCGNELVVLLTTANEKNVGFVGLHEQTLTQIQHVLSNR